MEMIMRWNKPQIQRKGFGLEDYYLSFQSGTDILRDSSRSATMFSKEITDIGLLLFPYPSSREPLFLMEGGTNNQRVKGIYDSIIVDTILTNDICEFFKGAIHEFINVGDAYFSIYWDEKKEHNTDFILPVDFHYLRTETIKEIVKNGAVVKYIQKYSKPGIRELKNLYPETSFDTISWEVVFNPDEIIHFKYPFAERTPAMDSMYLLKKDSMYMDAILRMKLGIHPHVKSYRVEKVRFKTFNDSKKLHDEKRASISKNFLYVPGMLMSQHTEFYEAYRTAQCYKKLNALRNYLLQTFNKQVMEVIKKKNALSENLNLILNWKFFSSDEEVDRYFKEYVDGNIDFNTMHKLIYKHKEVRA